MNHKTIAVLILILILPLGCSSLPSVKHSWHKFPEGKAFIGEPKKPYETLGIVRSEVNFPTLDPENSEERLCQNYFNKGVTQLVEYAKKQGGDAVIDVKSVVFLMDGRSEVYPKAECSDDGGEGQVLVRGIAVRWKTEKP